MRDSKAARLDFGAGELADVVLVGVRWPVERDASVPGRGVLHALRVRVENRGRAFGRAELDRITVTTTAGHSVEVDALVDLDDMSAGEAVEGWLVFELTPTDTPRELSFAQASGEIRSWHLESQDEQSRL